MLIHTHGNVALPVVGTFKQTFTKEIKEPIFKRLRNIVKEKVAEDLNLYMLKSGGMEKDYGGYPINFDWSIVDSPKVVDNTVGFGIKGLFTP